MTWIEPLSEDFLYCDPQEITTELYNVCTDEQATPAAEHKQQPSGDMSGALEEWRHD